MFSVSSIELMKFLKVRAASLNCKAIRPIKLRRAQMVQLVLVIPNFKG